MTFITVGMFSWIILYNAAYLFFGLGASLLLNCMLFTSSFVIFFHITIEMYKGCIFTGYPIINQDLKLKNSYRNQVLKYFIFTKVFDMILCCFIILDYSLSTNPNTKIEELLVNSSFSVDIFLLGYFIEILVTDVVAGFFVLDPQYLEVMEPEEGGRVQQGPEKALMSSDYSESESNFSDVYDLTGDGELWFGGRGGKRTKSRAQARTVDWQDVMLKEINISKGGGFERQKGLGIIYKGMYKDINVPYRPLILISR